MSGMEPIVIGSAIGAMTNRKNPLQGALIGGALGGFGGSFMSGAGSAGTAAGTAAETGALTGAGASTAANTAFMNPAGVNAAMGQTAGYTSAAVPSTIFSAPTAVNTAITPSIERPLSLSMPGVEPGQGYEYTLGDRLSQVGQFAQQNPVLTQMAAQTGQSLLSQQQPMLPPAGLMRGNQMQVQAPQYQVGVPKVSLI